MGFSRKFIGISRDNLLDIVICHIVVELFIEKHSIVLQYIVIILVIILT